VTDDARELDQFERLMSAGDRISEKIDSAIDPSALSGEIARFQQGMWALNSLLSGAPVVHASTGERREATDTSGAVRVVVAPNGLPESIELDDDWRRLVGAEGLAGAVEEACHNALTTGDEEPAPAGDRATRIDEVLAFVEGTGELPPGVPGIDVSQVRPRPYAEIVDEVFRAIDVADSVTAQFEVPETGEDTATRRIALSVAPFGLVSCTADPDWVGRQETADLNDALRSAVQSLQSGPAASLGSAANALAALPDLTRVLSELQALIADQDKLR
jgi:hypothetical protein